MAVTALGQKLNCPLLHIVHCLATDFASPLGLENEGDLGNRVGTAR